MMNYNPFYAASLPLVGLVLLWEAYKWVFLPPKPLRALPYVPLWVSWMPLIRSALRLPPVGQDVIYARHIEPRARRGKGAVVVWFGSRWCVLVVHILLIKQITAGSGIDDHFHKSGNHIKLSDSVIAQLTGANVISEYGETWRKFRRAMAGPIVRVEGYGALNVLSRGLVERLSKQSVWTGPQLNAVFQSFSTDCILATVFDKTPEQLAKEREQKSSLDALQACVKRHIFDPFFLAFPVFDRPLFQRLFPSRQQARRMVTHLEKEILALTLPGAESYKDADNAKQMMDEYLNKTASENDQKSKDPETINSFTPVDALLEEARSGRWTSQELADNIKILFIAGHENTQQAVNSIIYFLAKEVEWQAKVRNEIESIVFKQQGLYIEAAEMERLAMTSAFVLECLRLLPPLPQLINRACDQDTPLVLPPVGDDTTRVEAKSVIIPAGTYVGWNAYGVHRSGDCHHWYPDPTVFRPTRWGQDVESIRQKVRTSRQDGQFIAFHTGVRTCLGIRLSLRELIISVAHLVANFDMELISKPDEVHMTPGGPLRPVDATIRLSPRNEKASE